MVALLHFHGPNPRGHGKIQLSASWLVIIGGYGTWSLWGVVISIYIYIIYIYIYLTGIPTKLCAGMLPRLNDWASRTRPHRCPADFARGRGPWGATGGLPDTLLLLMYQPGFRKGTEVMLYHLWITEFIVSDTEGTGACALTLANTPGPTNCS